MEKIGCTYPILNETRVHAPYFHAIWGAHTWVWSYAPKWLPNACTSNSNSRYIEYWKVIKQTTHSWIDIINSTTCFWKLQLSFTNEIWDNLNITNEDCMSKEQCNLIQCYKNYIICTCTSALKELTRHWVLSPIFHSWNAGSLSLEWFQPQMKWGWLQVRYTNMHPKPPWQTSFVILWKHE
jgi:hypothetical protein